MSRTLNLLYKNHPYSTNAKNANSKGKRNQKRKIEDLLKDLNPHGKNEDSDDEHDSDPDEFYHDEDVSCKDNTIFFKAAVSESTVEKLIKIIDAKIRKYKKLASNKMLETCTPKPLYLHITSYGGDLLACFRAIDAIKRSQIPIYTVIDGYAASAATLMSIVGKKRYMTPNSYMLIHQLSSGSMGKFWEIKDDFENCETWMNDIYNLYLENTNMSREDLENHLSHDLWWKVDQCKSVGLVDEVYTHDNSL